MSALDDLVLDNGEFSEPFVDGVEFSEPFVDENGGISTTVTAHIDSAPTLDALTEPAELMPSSPSLGEQADKLFVLQSEIKAQEAAIAPLKAQLQGLKRKVMDELFASEQTMAAGAMGKITLKITEMPTVPAKQWEDLYEYIHANRAFHLLHKRLSTTAVMELMQEGEIVPGVEIFTKRDLMVSGK